MNRGFLTFTINLLGSLTLGLVAFCSPVLCSPARADWPRFLGERFDGVVSDALVIDPAVAPEQLWRIDVGEGYGLGAVSHGDYFHFDAVKNEERVERLRCFDMKSGQVKWSVDHSIRYRDLLGYEDGPRSTPTVDGDNVYTLGVSGQLCCRKRIDGSMVWNVDTHKQYGVVQNFFGVGASPLVLGDQVIVMVGGSPSDDQDVPPMQLDRVSANGSAVVAFHRESGKEIWKCGDDLASYSSPRTMKLRDRTLVLMFARAKLLLIDPENGTVKSSFEHRSGKLESVNAMMPLVEGEKIFLSECYEVGSVLLRASDAELEVVWKDPPRNRRSQAMRCHWATPILVDGFLYGCSGQNSPDSDFRCVEFATGKVQWDDGRRIRSSVTRVGERLALLEERGRFQWIEPSPAKLRVIAEYDLGEASQGKTGIRFPCWAAPVISGRHMLVRGDQQVVCFEMAVAE